MLKYKELQVTFSEIPNEITICVNITGCNIHCKGCHSPHLWKDEGEELTPKAIMDFLNKNRGVTAICFMGGDSNPEEVMQLCKYVKEHTILKTGWYSGKDFNINLLPFKYLDYYKTGPYIEALGGLNNKHTNQNLYEITHGESATFEDITSKFWK